MIGALVHIRSKQLGATHRHRRNAKFQGNSCLINSIHGTIRKTGPVCQVQPRAHTGPIWDSIQSTHHLKKCRQGNFSGMWANDSANRSYMLCSTGIELWPLIQVRDRTASDDQTQNAQPLKFGSKSKFLTMLGWPRKQAREVGPCTVHAAVVRVHGGRANWRMSDFLTALKSASKQDHGVNPLAVSLSLAVWSYINHAIRRFINWH